MSLRDNGLLVILADKGEGAGHLPIAESSLLQERTGRP